MSVHAKPDAAKTVSTLDVLKAKGARKLAVLTAYDFSGAALAERSGADMLLVGDSLGMVMLGRKDTLSVTLEEMIHHCRVVSETARRALVIGDMPFMSYETGVDDALRSAARLCREGGVRAVKLEGGVGVAAQVKALVAAGIPVCGHIGLTPQRVAVFGGFKVQGRSAAEARALMLDALALQEAGCFCVVLEAMPAPLAARITARLRIPTIGIGAGPHCDGQVLVYHDVLGLYSEFTPKFVKQYAQAGELIQEALSRYVADVVSGDFPGPEHSFSMKDEETRELDRLLAEQGI